MLRPYLEQLTEAEGVSVEPAVFPLVVRAGGGSARDSLSVLDQLIAGAGPDGVTYARAVALLGVTDVALIDEMCDALAAGDGAAAYATVDRVAEAGHDPRRFASDLLERLRDLIVLQQVPDAAAKGLIDGPADQLERMAAQAQRLGPATLSRCADIVHNGLVEMRGTTAPRLLLELICARMLLPGADDSDRRPAAAPGTDGAPAHPGRRRAAAGHRRLRTRHHTAASTPPSLGRPPPAAAGAVRPAGARRPRRACARPLRARPHPGPPVPPRPAPAGPPGVDSPPGRCPPGTAPPRRPVAQRGRPGPDGPAGAALGGDARPGHPRAAAPGCAGALDAVAVRRVWPDVVGKVSRTSKRVAALVREATVREVDGDSPSLLDVPLPVPRPDAVRPGPTCSSRRSTRSSAVVGRSAARWPASGVARSALPRQSPAAPARPTAPPSRHRRSGRSERWSGVRAVGPERPGPGRFRAHARPGLGPRPGCGPPSPASPVRPVRPRRGPRRCGAPIGGPAGPGGRARPGRGSGRLDQCGRWGRRRGRPRARPAEPQRRFRVRRVARHPPAPAARCDGDRDARRPGGARCARRTQAGGPPPTSPPAAGTAGAPVRQRDRGGAGGCGG